MTSLCRERQVAKDDLRIEANGMIDELNARIGVARSLTADEALKADLRAIQKRLEKVMTVIASLTEEAAPAAPKALPDCELDLKGLERRIDALQTGVPFRFVSLGESLPSAVLHLARTQCRTCERRLVTLIRQYPLDENLLCWFNRLSDYLFVMAENSASSSPAPKE